MKLGRLLVLLCLLVWLSIRLAAQWEQYNPGRVSIYEFPEALGIPHHMIDPNQPDAKTQITYPKILELLRVKPS